MTDDNEVEGRRPIAARNTGWADGIARKLASTGITPNQISILSMVFAFIASVAYVFVRREDASGIGVQIGLLGLAILAIQMRLLCNLFDGMVAVEGGKGAKDGPFWNEFPDRVSDIMIFAAAGYAIHSPTLGWIAAALAVLVAYVRELGRAVGLEADFSGPMAKQHRMALLSFGSFVMIFELVFEWSIRAINASLVLIIAGSILTILLRSAKQVSALKRGDAE